VFIYVARIDASANIMPYRYLGIIIRNVSGFSLMYTRYSFVDFHVDVACNTNASDVCKIMFTYLLTYILFRSFNYADGNTVYM